jgi:hypothetical protein
VDPLRKGWGGNGEAEEAIAPKGKANLLLRPRGEGQDPPFGLHLPLQGGEADAQGNVPPVLEEEAEFLAKGPGGGSKVQAGTGGHQKGAADPCPLSL